MKKEVKPVHAKPKDDCEDKKPSLTSKEHRVSSKPNESQGGLKNQKNNSSWKETLLIGVALLFLSLFIAQVIWPWADSEVLRNKPILQLNIGKYSFDANSDKYLMDGLQILDYEGRCFEYKIIDYCGEGDGTSERTSRSTFPFLSPDEVFMHSNLSYEKIKECPAYVLNLENHGNKIATDVQLTVEYDDAGGWFRNPNHHWEKILPGDGHFIVVYACEFHDVEVYASNADSPKKDTIEYVLVPCEEFVCENPAPVWYCES